MKRLQILHIGVNILTFFLISSFCLTIIYGFGYYTIFYEQLNMIPIVILTFFSIFLEIILFWIGITLVYLTSVQLGIKLRVIGIVCGWVPIINLFCLFHILKITRNEYVFEIEKWKKNERRKNLQLCETKYPILLVHGVFFRDFEHLNYWGRIPDELQKNGAVIHYGNHNSAASVEDSARELEERILEIRKETGAEKVNIIAHSKGGLDARCAIYHGCGKYVASLTTINTPHRGCEFANYLLGKIPKKIQEKVAVTYNKTAEKFGDKNPDFLAAVYDLTSEKCVKRNTYMFDDPSVYYQSFGSKLNCASNGKFPLNYSYHLVKYFDGNNDGLVGEDSFAWGQNYTFLTCNGERGISHADMIDLNRENIREFDVREFYVDLVHNLKNLGF